MSGGGRWWGRSGPSLFFLHPLAFAPLTELEGSVLSAWKE